MEKKFRLTLIAFSMFTILSIGFSSIPSYAVPSSQVAIIGGPVIQFGGNIPTTDAAFAGFTFANIAPGVGAIVGALGPFDTVVLNAASSQVNCNLTGAGTITGAELAELVAFALAGGKLIVYDSECPMNDFMWLPLNLQFMTINPGQAGAGGTAQIVEENVLSTTPVTGAADIDVIALCSDDACGDSNTLTAVGTDLCLDIEVDNVFMTGFEPVHVYNKAGSFGLGMLIYNGLDYDFASPGTTPSPTGSSGGVLAQLFLNELNAMFNPHAESLSCGTVVQPPRTVGGSMLTIDTSALLLAGASSISMWMIPVVIAGIGIGVFVIKRKK